VLALGVRYFVRFNILGCFLVVAGTSLLGGMSELAHPARAVLPHDGYALLVALVLLLCGPWQHGAWGIRQERSQQISVQ